MNFNNIDTNDMLLVYDHYLDIYIHADYGSRQELSALYVLQIISDYCGIVKSSSSIGVHGF